MLRMLNERHAVISDIGGKCRVVGEVLDRNLERPRTRISKQSFEDFRNRYMNKKVESGQAKDGSPTYTPAGKWWLEHPMRRQFETMVFAPGREVPEAYSRLSRPMYDLFLFGLPAACRLLRLSPRERARDRHHRSRT